MITPDVTVYLSFPNARLNPNQSKGVHWAATSTLRKKAHRDAYYAATAALSSARWKPAQGDVAVTITFIQPDRRRRDRDNLLAALKWGLDGVAEAIGVDDSRFEPLTIRREFGSKPGSVRIEIFNPAQ